MYREAVVKTGFQNQIRQSHSLIGMLALAEKNYPKAIENFRLGDMEDIYSLYHLALVHLASGDSSKAYEYCNNVVDFNELIEYNYAFIRTKARTLSDKLSKQLNH